ncbi:rhomboid family intramembrane serine protease [Pseudomonadales bacterium]|jgi:rhomboid protease GluP|nr:rhomboid family intramembrane serine protease [Pseudomonadales bacterium]
MIIHFSQSAITSETKARTTSTICVLSLAIGVAILVSNSPLSSNPLSIVLPTSMIFIASYYLRLVYLKRKHGACIRVRNNNLELPTLTNPKVNKIVPLEHIFSKKVVNFARHTLLRIDYIGGTFILKEKDLSKPEQLRELYNLLETNLKLETKYARPYATLIVGFAIALIGISIFQADSLTTHFDSISYGAWQKDLVLDGEIFRSFTYLFLHLNYLHLQTNILIFILLGFALEHRLGWLHFLIIFFLGGMFASIPGFKTDFFYIIGASGGVYALAGAYIVDRYLRPSPLLERFKQITLYAILGGLFADIVFSLFIINVAYTVHLAGLIFGAIYVFVYHKFRLTNLMRALALPVVAAALLTGIHFAQLSNASKLDRALMWLKENDSEQKVLMAAWFVSLNTDSSEEHLKTALTALGQLELSAGSKDTYATLLARSGNLVEAIEIENELVYFQPAYGTQLARFEQRLTEDEPIDLKPFASSKIIAIDAICNKRYFARHVTHTVIDIPSICEGQEIIFIRNARDTDKSLRYELDPKLMALPL